MSSLKTNEAPSISSETDLPKGRSTYGQILKSSALIGGSSVFTIIFGIVRNKAFAVLLGPAGVGVLGLFVSILELARNIAIMGLNSSGVRQIAEANTSGDDKQIAATALLLRRVVAFFAFGGAVALLIFCKPVAWISFENADYAAGIAMLSIAVFLSTVSAGQIALLQGMRRIADLARANVLGALFGTLGGVGVVYLFRERGIVPSLVCVALASLITSWWYSRKIQFAAISMSLRQVFREASGLLKLGFVFMTTGLMALGVGYLIRIIVMRQLGADAAGYYHAAWVLGGLYVGFILQAMGADFFPRLTTVAKDHSECNRLVNEQAETSLLLAGPGILGTLTFAAWVIFLFYDASFTPAVEVLRWFCLGMMMRVASWPMGFILLAKGARRAFFWSELASNVIQLGFVWYGVKLFGLRGVGIAFFVSYLCYWILIYTIVRLMSGYRWSAANKRIGFLYLITMPSVFAAPYFDLRLGLIGGCIITVIIGIYSVRKVCSLIPFGRFPQPIQRILTMLRLAPRDREISK